MARRPKRNRAVFKAKVALEAIKGDQTAVDLAERFQLHSNQITEWKKQLVERADDSPKTRKQKQDRISKACTLKSNNWRRKPDDVYWSTLPQ